MSDSSVYLQPAFILQSRKYRESSLILDVLTRDYGVIAILAKGVRKKKSKTAGVLLAFSALKLSYIGKNELKILTHAELDAQDIKLQGLPLYCGFYLNELVALFLHKYDPYPEVFFEYQQCLEKLVVAKNIEQVLRFFELNLMQYTGYGMQLAVEGISCSAVQAEKKYSYRGDVGMVESAGGVVCGETLIAMENRQPLNKQALAEAKQLMRKIIDYQLQGRPVKSRAVLATVIKRL